MMPLTEAQRLESDGNRLRALIAEVAEAQRSGDDMVVMNAKEALLDFSSSNDELNQAATEALTTANLTDLAAAIGEFARIARNIGAVKSGLERAVTAANSGRKELLVPKLAETSTKALTELKVLREGIEQLVEQAGDAQDLNELVELLPNAIEQLDNVRKAAKNIGN
jgi:hypothetical protein